MFNCEKCTFVCSHKRDYDRHVITRKHLNRTGEINADCVNKKPSTFVCQVCDYVCRRSADYKRHLKTARHLSTAGGEPDTQNIAQCFTHSCTVCGKEYSSRNSLWYHSKQCTGTDTNVSNDSHTGNADFMQCIQTMLVRQAEAHAEQIAVLIGSQVLQTQAQTQTLAQIATQTQAHAEAHAEQIKLLNGIICKSLVLDRETDKINIM